MWSVYYVQKGGALIEGESVATGTGWVNWGAWVLDRHTEYPEAAHLAQEGWQDWDGDPDDLDHELNEMLHAPNLDRNDSAITAQLLAALRARPDNTLSILISDGEMVEEDTAAESIFGPSEVETLERLVENAVRRFLTERGGNLIDKEVTVHRSDGSTFKQHRKVLADQPGAADDQGQHQGGEHHVHELSDDDKKSISDSIEHDLASMPEGQRPPAGLIAKAKDIAISAGAKALIWLHKFNESMLGKFVMEGIDTYFDGPTDLKKFGYNPSNSSGLDRSGGAVGHDPIRDATKNLFDQVGIPGAVGGHVVAKIAAVVITKATLWAKKKLTGAKTEDMDHMDHMDGAELWGEFISQLLSHLNEQFGIQSGAPDAATVTAAIRKLKGKGGAR